MDIFRAPSQHQLGINGDAVSKQLKMKVRAGGPVNENGAGKA